MVKSLSSKDFILDSEIVAYDLEEQKILPFQILSTRKRKVNSVHEIDSNVCIMCFDILYFDKEDLCSEFLQKRKEILRENFKEEKGRFEFTKTEICKDVNNIETIFNESISENFEGLMIKAPMGIYMPSKRSSSWMKLKKDYIESIGDTLDLVVMGVYYGKGERAGVYGGFLIGSYDEQSENVETICKLGTGFDDSFLSDFYNNNKGYETDIRPKNFLSSSVVPDKWIGKNIIFEIKAAEISLSPIYDSCKRFLKYKGVSLRFPRFIRERLDKVIDDSTSSKTIFDLYNKLK